MIKCLKCGTILYSNSQHDFVKCPCNNETFEDGGQGISQRVGGKSLDYIKSLYNCATCKFFRSVEERELGYLKGKCVGFPVWVNRKVYFQEENEIIWDKFTNQIYNLRGVEIEECKVWKSMFQEYN